MTQAETPRLIGAGSIFIDDIVLPDGRTYMACSGGGVLHALLGARVWDERPGLVGFVGQGLPEHTGTLIHKHFDTRGLYELPIPQMRAWQLFEEDGSRREVYRVAETEIFINGPGPEHLPDVYRDAAGVYLLQGYEGIRRWREVLDGLVLWEPLQQVMLPQNRALMRETLRACRIEIVSPNLVEAQAVYGLETPQDLANALLDDGAQVVALRMGPRGSLVAARETGTRWLIPAAAVPAVVDQTGAGNTYCGGLLAGLLQGHELAQAGAMAAAAASFCIEQVGALDPEMVQTAERDRRYAAVLAGISPAG